MRIRVRIGDVEIETRQWCKTDMSPAATSRDGWNRGSDQQQLMKTVREIVGIAVDAHRTLYDFEEVNDDD